MKPRPGVLGIRAGCGGKQYNPQHRELEAGARGDSLAHPQTLSPLPACLEFRLAPPCAYSETLGGSWNIRDEPRPSAAAPAFPPGPSRGQESAQMPLPPAWAPPLDTCVRSSAAWPDAHIRCLGRLTAGGLSVVALGKRREDWPGMGEGGCSGPGPSTCRPWTLRGGGVGGHLSASGSRPNPHSCPHPQAWTRGNA